MANEARRRHHVRVYEEALEEVEQKVSEAQSDLNEQARILSEKYARLHGLKDKRLKLRKELKRHKSKLKE